MQGERAYVPGDWKLGYNLILVLWLWKLQNSLFYNYINYTISMHAGILGLHAGIIDNIYFQLIESLHVQCIIIICVCLCRLLEQPAARAAHLDPNSHLSAVCGGAGIIGRGPDSQGKCEFACTQNIAIYRASESDPVIDAHYFTHDHAVHRASLNSRPLCVNMTFFVRFFPREILNATWIQRGLEPKTQHRAAWLIPVMYDSSYNTRSCTQPPPACNSIYSVYT